MKKTTERMRLLPATSWCLYDFANTIYSAVVVTLAFQKHLCELTGKEKFAFTTLSLGLVASGLAVPVCGAISDRTGQAKRYLVWITAICCTCTIAMSATVSVGLLLALYFVTTFTYNTALVFYNALVVEVADRKHVGRITGIGVGLGYLGTAFALPVALYLCDWFANNGMGITRDGRLLSMAPAFMVAGVLFFIFSIPLVVWVPRQHVANPESLSLGVVSAGARRLLATLRMAPRNRNLFCFLVANFLCLDSVNATINCFQRYVENALGLGIKRAAIYMVAFSVVALFSGALAGWLADRFGSKPVLVAATVVFLITLTGCVLTTSEKVFAVLFVGLGTFGLAGTWTAGRKLLVSLAPPDELGEYFGLYGVTQKLSIIGTMLFGWVADWGLGGSVSRNYRIALACLIPTMLIGLLFLAQVRVRDSARDIEAQTRGG